VKQAENAQPSPWKKTPVANLVRYEPSGIYFARVRVGGKLIRRSLATDRMNVAQLRLGDLIKEARQLQEARTETSKGRMTVAAALESYRRRVEDDPRLKPSAKLYRRKCIHALLKSWPAFEQADVRKISEADCARWASDFVKEYSATVYNNTVGTLRQILNVAVEEGSRYGNPAMKIKKARVRPKELNLPSQEQFVRFVKTIEEGGGWCSRACAEFVRFLAFGGFRKSEAAQITWGDCDMKKEEFRVRGDQLTGTKNWEFRNVPMIPEAVDLLKRLRSVRPTEPDTAAVMEVKECQKAMDRAAAKVGMARITHHDLRHLFATRCIESGVDIPTVSRWLGHKDGGALAMRVYGHLRDHHSTEMAKKVTFGTAKAPGEPATATGAA
jgi:integrase